MPRPRNHPHLYRTYSLWLMQCCAFDNACAAAAAAVLQAATGGAPAGGFKGGFRK
jgi:hypothetical protein